MRRHDLIILIVGRHDKILAKTGLGRLEDQPEPVRSFIISYRYSYKISFFFFFFLKKNDEEMMRGEKR